MFKNCRNQTRLEANVQLYYCSGNSGEVSSNAGRERESESASLVLVRCSLIVVPTLNISGDGPSRYALLGIVVKFLPSHSASQTSNLFLTPTPSMGTLLVYFGKKPVKIRLCFGHALILP